VKKGARGGTRSSEHRRRRGPDPEAVEPLGPGEGVEVSPGVEVPEGLEVSPGEEVAPGEVIPPGEEVPPGEEIRIGRGAKGR
jgi:hypothetical protein